MCGAYRILRRHVICQITQGHSISQSHWETYTLFPKGIEAEVTSTVDSLQTLCRFFRRALYRGPAAATSKSRGKIYGDILYPLSDFKYIIQRRKGGKGGREG